MWQQGIQSKYEHSSLWVVFLLRIEQFITEADIQLHPSVVK